MEVNAASQNYVNEVPLNSGGTLICQIVTGSFSRCGLPGNYQEHNLLRPLDKHLEHCVSLISLWAGKSE